MNIHDALMGQGRTRTFVSRVNHVPPAKQVAIDPILRALDYDSLVHMMETIIDVMDEGPKRDEAEQYMADAQDKYRTTQSCCGGGAPGLAMMRVWIAKHDHGEDAAGCDHNKLAKANV